MVWGPCSLVHKILVRLLRQTMMCLIHYKVRRFHIVHVRPRNGPYDCGRQISSLLHVALVCSGLCLQYAGKLREVVITLQGA